MENHPEQVRLIALEQVKDQRGWLVAIESNSTLPILFKRMFYMGGISESGVRGAHANRDSSFFMVAVSGSCLVETNDGNQKRSFELDSHSKGLFIPKMVWKEMKNFTKDCVLVVLSDRNFDPNEYLSDFDEYLGVMKKNEII